MTPTREQPEGRRPSADRRHLILVGMMGSGKSTVGERLAARLGRPLVDTDELVVATAGRSIPELFADVGESGFRALERVAVADACAAADPVVIACGGGAVLDPDNRRALAAAGVVVWLRATPAQLAARVGDGDGRPLLTGETPLGTLERLATLRAPSYEGVADIVVDTDGLAPDAVTERVLEEVAACAA